jgi:2-polyprenyl-3-methyl-5-hydroxy-6-metoxy-1,4-benzoquinol methylase
MTDFDKYEKYGAYHWNDIDKTSLKKLFSRSIPTLCRYDRLLRAIPDDARTIVDIGCGDGALTYLLASREMAREVIGCDMDKIGIDLARDKVIDLPFSDKITLKNKSISQCEIGPRSVDAIIMCEVIEHVEDVSELLEEIQKIGRPGGVLVITTPRKKRDGSKWDQHHVLEYTEDNLYELISQYFPNTTVSHFMPTPVYYLYNKMKTLFNILYTLGVNPLNLSLQKYTHVNLCSVSYF